MGNQRLDSADSCCCHLAPCQLHLGGGFYPLSWFFNLSAPPADPPYVCFLFSEMTWIHWGSCKNIARFAPFTANIWKYQRGIELGSHCWFWSSRTVQFSKFYHSDQIVILITYCLPGLQVLSSFRIHWLFKMTDIDGMKLSFTEDKYLSPRWLNGRLAGQWRAAAPG